MRRFFLVGLILVFLMWFNVAYSRLFFVGSNPYFSVMAFPQDVGFFKRDYVSYTMAYQSMPWWGDVDEPSNKPDDSYASSEEHITFAQYTNDTQSPTFNRSGYATVIKNTVRFVKNLKSGFNFMVDLIYKSRSLESSADGNMRVVKDDESISYIPFSYSSSSFGYDVHLISTFGYRIKGIPVGLKLGIGRQTFGEPSSHLSATVDGINVDSDRILWGWSTTGCNHIFGYHHTTADAWFLNDYSVGSVYQYDFQIGATLSAVKLGGRVRIKSGKLDSYVWHSVTNAGDSTNISLILKANFEGDYEKRKWAKDIYESEYRLYGNIRFVKTKYIGLNLLIFLGRSSYTAENVNSDNPDLSANQKEKLVNYTVEANPNVSINLGRGVIFESAVLLEFSKTKYENTYERWNPYIGGSKEVYWDTGPYIGDEVAWENFGYADEYFFDIGLDMSILIPVLKIRKHRLVAFVTLFHNHKHTRTTKYFGDNEVTETDIVYNVDYTRENKRFETWINSSLMLSYYYGEWFFRIMYVEPLVYQMDFSTEVLDSSGETLYYRERSMQTAVQETAKVSVHPDPSVMGGGMLLISVGHFL